MWHEARRMDKAIYQTLNTTAKRKEQARRAHELANASKDPTESLYIQGHSLTIHTDVNITQAAAESNTMTKWQGDDTLIIDRFDARNLLDVIPVKMTHLPASMEPRNVDEYITELQLDYERFKELILVTFTGDDDAHVLRAIAARHVRIAQAKTIKKRFHRKPVPSKKATIDFAYDNHDDDDAVNAIGSHHVKPNEGGTAASDSSEDDDNDDDDLYSAKLASVVFSTQDWQRIDEIAERFHLPRDAFSKLYEVDRGEELDVAKLNEIERERLNLSGKNGRRERVRLKRRKQLILKDPLNEDAIHVLRRFAVRRFRQFQTEEGSSSNSDEDEVEEKTEFITSFGTSNVPSSSASSSLAKVVVCRENALPLPLDATVLPRRSRIKRDSRSASPFGDAWGLLKSTAKQTQDDAVSTTRIAVRRTMTPSGDVAGSGWLSSRLKHLRRKAASPSPPPSAISSADSADDAVMAADEDAALVVRSSMSESEKERIEIENRKRRVRRTKRELKRRMKMTMSDAEDSEDEDSRKRTIAAKQLRQHLQTNLSKTHKEMLEEERDKKAHLTEELKSRNAGEYVQRKLSRSLSPPSKRQSTSRSRSRSRSPPPRRRSRSPDRRRHHHHRRRRSRSNSQERRSRERSRHRLWMQHR